MRTCRECGGRLVLSSDCTYVCERCGLVHDVPLEGGEEFYRRKISGPLLLDGLEEGSLIHFHYGNLTASTSMRFSRMKRVHMHSKMISRRIMELHAIRSLRLITHKLSIPSYVERRAVKIYLDLSRRLHERKEELLGPKRKLNHFRLAAVALLLACKEFNVNIRTQKIVDAFKRSGHKVTMGGLIEGLWLAKKAGVYAPRNTLQKLVRNSFKVLRRRFNSNHNNEALRKAEDLGIEISKRIRGNVLIQGRNPSVLAAAIAYIAINSLQEPNGNVYVSLAEVSRVTGHSPSAIRACVQIIRKILEAQGTNAC